MNNKLIVGVLWILSVAIAYVSGWFKGVASAPRIAVESASAIGYLGLFVVGAIVVGVVYFMATRKKRIEI